MIIIRLGVIVSPLLYMCSDRLVTTNYQCLAVLLIYYLIVGGTTRKWLTLVNVRTIPLAVQPPVDLNLELSQRCVWRGHHSPMLCTFQKLDASSPAVSQRQVP